MILLDTHCVFEGPEVQAPSGSAVVRGYTEINQTSVKQVHLNRSEQKS